MYVCEYIYIYVYMRVFECVMSYDWMFKCRQLTQRQNPTSQLQVSPIPVAHIQTNGKILPELYMEWSGSTESEGIVWTGQE